MTRLVCVMCIASVVTAVATGNSADGTRQRDSEGSRALARARSAIAPDRNLDAIRAIGAKGRRIARNLSYGPGNAAREFLDNPIELRILLPDHFLEIAVRASGASARTGFRGNQGLNGKPAEAYQKLFLARLALGVLLRTNTTVRLSLDRSSTASVLTFTGSDRFHMKSCSTGQRACLRDFAGGTAGSATAVRTISSGPWRIIR